ncbi:MAG: DUF1294 domain-containing protein [Planctomycetota bacterium]
MPRFLWWAVLALNVVTFAVYGVDKRQSRVEGRRRVPERTLLWLLFLGGIAGAWAAMRLFRHKTRKQPFGRYAVLWTLLSPVWGLVWWSWRELTA